MASLSGDPGGYSGYSSSVTIELDVRAPNPGLTKIKISSRGTITWKINEGIGLLVFDPSKEIPVDLPQSHKFTESNPAQANVVASPGEEHTHFVCCWYDDNGIRKDHGGTFMLVIGP